MSNNIIKGGYIINGYNNEYEIITYLNGKYLKEVHPIFRELIEKLYPNVSGESVIHASKYGRYAKCDMVIEINGIKKGVSIKKGSRNSVHVEKVHSFLDYIGKIGFKNKEELLRYLYSDGTNNNTGKKRISSEEFKKANIKQIDCINKELNSKIVLNGLIYRFLICSDINYKVKVDAFIYGSVNDFIWCTKDEITSYLLNNSVFKSTGVHAGKLFIQLWNKNLNNNIRYEWCREYIQIKWYSIFDDIISIMCNR